MDGATRKKVVGYLVAREEGGRFFCPTHREVLEPVGRNAFGQERFSCPTCGTGEEDLWYRYKRVIMRSS